MAKKKKKTGSGTSSEKISDKSYLTSGSARKLPIYKCLAYNTWKETGITHVYVLRQHVNGNLSVGIFLVDLKCAGVKDSFFVLNTPRHEIEEKVLKSPIPLQEIPYVLAHNIIYGAVAFANDFDIEPDPSFALTSYLLEEDTEAIELIEIEFGDKGKPVLYLNPDSAPKASYYLRLLEKHAGPGNYTVKRGYHDEAGFEDEDFDDDDFDDEEDDLEDFYDFPEEWNKAEWEEFIAETDTEELMDYPDAAIMIYEKVFKAPQEAVDFLTSQTEEVGIKITYEPLPTPYTPEELEEASSYVEMATGVISSKSDILKLKKRLLKSIEKWPNNPIFWNYLAVAYGLLDEKEKADETVFELTQRFPDYLHGKIQYAMMLMNQGRLDKVMPVFDNNYHLQGLYPDRDTFHVHEMVVFNTVIADYFFRTGNLHMAKTHLDIVTNLDLPEQYPINYSLILKINLAIIKEVEPVLQEAKQDERKKQELIAQLLN